MDILKIYEQNILSYEKIIKKTFKRINNLNGIKNSVIDVSIIIPIKGRQNQIIPLINNFKESFLHYDKINYSMTFVENDDIPLNKNIITSTDVNYIFLKKETKEEFNKCLSMNVGAFLVKGKYFLFHDVDILVKKDFFKNIFLNIEKHNNVNVLHPFSGRRVVYLNKEKSEMVRKNLLDINDINTINPYESHNTDVIYGKSGAPGGSILVKSELFFNIGGYDDSFFKGYSPEDHFFWSKLETIEKINSCDNPKNEVFHLEHDVLHRPPNQFYKLLCDKFDNSDYNERMEYIKIKSKNFTYGEITEKF